MNVEPTAQIIDEMAKTMRDYANSLDRVAKKMREREDFEYASEAIITATNCLQNMRLDLLITRPLRELQRQKTREEE